MIIYSVFALFSLLLESVIPNLLSNVICFFIMALLVVVNMFNPSLKKAIIITFITGVVYDLLYTDFVFLHGFIFSLTFYVLSVLLYGRKNFLLNFLFYLFSCLTYTLLIFLTSFLYTNVSLSNIILTILNSAFINVSFFIIIYLVFYLISSIKHKNDKSAY